MTYNVSSGTFSLYSTTTTTIVTMSADPPWITKIKKNQACCC